jgi:hypothetical protein
VENVSNKESDDMKGKLKLKGYNKSLRREEISFSEDEGGGIWF